MGQCASNASGKTLTTSTINDAKSAQSIDTQKVVPTAVSSAEINRTSPSNNANTNNVNGTSASSIVPSIVPSSVSASYDEQALPQYKAESKEETTNATNSETTPKITITSIQTSVPTVLVTPASTTISSSSSPSSQKEEDEWRLAVKNVLCSLLERLLEIVDNDREALTAIVSQLNLPNIIQLFNGKQFEALLRETFVLPSLEPTVPTTNPQYDELRLGLFLSVLRSSSSNVPTSTSTSITYQPSRPTRQQLAVNLIKICESTQQQLFTAANLVKDSKLQCHLLFFARTFTFATRTDIVNRIEALYENIDQVIAAS